MIELSDILSVPLIRQTVENTSRINVHAFIKVVRSSKEAIVSIHDHTAGKRFLGLAVVQDASVRIHSNGAMITFEIKASPGRLGGVTYSWVCPSCARGCYHLYFVGNQAVCRHCAKLTYESQHTNALGRTLKNAQKRLSEFAKDGTSTPLGRPHGMWRRTYRRKLSQLARIYSYARGGGKDVR